jgi:8-oxo-dGTP diphosphatase
MRPDMWEHPGGKIEPGETAFLAVIRECQEELGVIVMPLANGVIGTGMLDLVTHQIVLTMIEVLIVGGTPRPLASVELRWIDPQYAVDHMPCSPMTYPLHRALISYLRAKRIDVNPGWGAA